MWHAMDANNDGHIMYKEAEESLKKFFHGDQIIKARPAIRRAFDFAKDYIHVGSKKKKTGKDNSIEKKEFRIFLVALR